MMINKEIFKMDNIKRTNQLKHIFGLWLSCLLLFSYGCEDPIEVNLEDGGTQLVVDGWIDNLAEPQIITLSLSQQYFDNTPPPRVTDAEVTITRQDGAVFDFVHDEQGQYVWTPNGSSLGDTDDIFTLKINYNNSLYTSTNTIHRTQVIDSIGVEFREDEILLDDGLYAQFYARDFAGIGDTYWIKTFRNGQYLEKSQELNIAYDAGFDAGTGIDGLIFIPPIRELVNPLDDDLLSVPYTDGDEIRIEIHSISNQAFNFLEIARDQINNGDNGIFSIPLANTRTNIQNDDGQMVLGFFNIAGVSRLTKIVEE